MMSKALQQFRSTHNGNLPTRIMYFRDSIGDTRYGMMIGSELMGIGGATRAERG